MAISDTGRVIKTDFMLSVKRWNVFIEQGKPELMKPDLELDIVKEKPFAPKSIKYKEYADKLSEGGKLYTELGKLIRAIL